MRQALHDLLHLLAPRTVVHWYLYLSLLASLGVSVLFRSGFAGGVVLFIALAGLLFFWES